MNDKPETTEFVLRGIKTIRLVASAIGSEMEYLQNIISDDTWDEEIRINASNDLGLYRAILIEMGDPR